eukprot:CAMPEP_0183353758 /NCGR_PEP_ID=MMETSP0164_2-20130417/34906_1 /TAXON_ID=221442 /ORGANISM="Coccolithus pelagicus ssp braarudi, Strain PLY182g" /LENGTH=113 /DNA_ID=CAMNT_0025526493 /DNA_START=361 /DNA_END=702 /DNA_ORIENTATION=+
MLRHRQPYSLGGAEDEVQAGIALDNVGHFPNLRLPAPLFKLLLHVAWPKSAEVTRGPVRAAVAALLRILAKSSLRTAGCLDLTLVRHELGVRFLEADALSRVAGAARDRVARS